MADKKTEPTAPVAMCDRHGCGMPAVGNTNRLNHCENHATWAEAMEKDARVILALKGA